VSSTAPRNHATTLLKVGRASRPTILSLELSHALRIGILYPVHSDQNAVTITRAGKLRQTRNLATKDDSEAMKVFNSGKTGGRGEQCRPKLRWLDSRDRNTYVLKANSL
jgi:hypothetical protein